MDVYRHTAVNSSAAVSSAGRAAGEIDAVQTSPWLAAELTPQQLTNLRSMPPAPSLRTRPRLIVRVPRPIVDVVSEANQQAIRAFFAGLDDEAHDLAERLAHGDDESVWAWFERRYPKATKRAAKDRHWRDFVKAIREFYGDESGFQ